MFSKIKKMVLPLFALSLITAGPFVNNPEASAALWRIEATGTQNNVNDFWFILADDGDTGAVVVSDLIDFSGVTIDQGNSGKSNFYGTLTGIPDMTVTDGGLTLTLVGEGPGRDQLWDFEGTTASEMGPASLSPASFNGNVGHWTYTAQVVPTPGAIWLLDSAFVGIVGIRRKLKK